MPTSYIKGLKCPGCGGTVDLEEGDRVAGCSFCNSSLYVRGDSGSPQFWSPFGISDNDAKGAVRKWLTGMNKASDLKNKADLNQITPIYIPFYRIQMKAFGFVLGRERQGKDDYRDVERKIEKEFDWNAPACNTGDLGVEWVDMKNADVKHFHKEEVEKHGMIFDPVLKEEDVMRDAKGKFQEHIERQELIAMTETRFKKIFLTEKKVSIVYYPLWIVRYAYRKRTYQVVIDGRTAEVVHGKAPGNNLYRSAMLVFFIMLGNLILTGMLQNPQSSNSSNDGLSGLVFTFLVPAAIMLYGYSKFRYGGVIEENIALKKPDSLVMKSVDLNEMVKDFIQDSSSMGGGRSGK